MVFRVLSGVAAALVLSSSALADDLNVEDFIAQAVQSAEENSTYRWAFTITHTQEDDGEEKSYKLRYDPRRDEDDRWVLLEPAYDDLSKKERKFLKKMQKGGESGQTPDEALFYDQLKIDPEALRIVDETDTHLVVASPMVDEDTPEKIKKSLEVTVRLNKAHHYIEEIVVDAIQPFKPVPIAKVLEFHQVQRFAPLDGSDNGALAALQSSESTMRGKAVTKKFGESSSTVYSDFERIENAGVQIEAIEQPMADL